MQFRVPLAFDHVHDGIGERGAQASAEGAHAELTTLRYVRSVAMTEADVIEILG
jgi:hypothetical protein